MNDLPPLPPAIVCSMAAAASYSVPANVLLAVADMEGGRPGLWVLNANGTYDVGPMQFNTDYLKTLAPYGITPAAVAADNCYPYQLAAWRLRNHIVDDNGDLWTRVSNYHSRNAQFNQPYRLGLMRRARYWAEWLASRFRTYDMTDPLERVRPATQSEEQRKPIKQRAARATIKPHAAYVSRSIAIREPSMQAAGDVPLTITIREPTEEGVP
jgi:hypothetical protein